MVLVATNIIGRPMLLGKYVMEKTVCHTSCIHMLRKLCTIVQFWIFYFRHSDKSTNSNIKGKVTEPQPTLIFIFN